MLREQVQLLGLPVRDRVTGFSGIVTSICFDLYGCVQAIITPPVREGKREPSEWYDVKRLEVTGERVMDAPEFGGKPGDETGPETKPAFPSHPIR